MHVRKSVVAGRFYPGTAQQLRSYFDRLFPAVAEKEQDDPCALMVPHAGYVYSAPVAARTLANTRLPKTLVIFCPNHTGLGASRFGVWPDGCWETPLGSVRVNDDLALRLAAHRPYGADTLCHARDHAIEVELPLLQYLCTDFDIVPVCVASHNLPDLRAAGEALAVEAGNGIRDGSIGILVSSDMNHYESPAVTTAKDREALAHVLAEDAPGLVQCCVQRHITMCGAGPMAIALFALKALRDSPSRAPRLMGHTHSGEVALSDKVVGYAGVRFYN